jgi:wyosine [tRNA(Phe)-imidazoG37] synthetase (radical SAM superfamily)
MRYIYGPVESRRLGKSLGISLTPWKICNFDCVYCQLGATRQTVSERKAYVPVEDIVSEFKSWLGYNAQDASKLNFVTLSGMGEPTLNTGIGELIKEIKKLSAAKVAVITNASLMSEPSVRQALGQADLIVPSLDAADEKTFEKIDRPDGSVRIEDIISGLIALRKEFRGQIWLEVMLVKGLNDSREHIRKLKEKIDLIDPDKIQLNSPVRTTAESGVEALGKEKLEEIREMLGERCEIY